MNTPKYIVVDATQSTLEIEFQADSMIEVIDWCRGQHDNIEDWAIYCLSSEQLVMGKDRA
jgi:hypothetical protein